ncbi:MAG TPA: hypothetical protein VMF62_06625 [Acetobacteraceae bacterium]|jgi:hypothetical protein|nr:hypothetical protein [Acetobacteraceae bacterium]
MYGFSAGPILLWHLIPLFAMLMMVTVNVGTNRGFAIVQARRDGRRYRAAIAAELASLAELVRENIRLLRTEAGYVLSCRSVTAVYRGTMGRLTFLGEEEIAAVVATYVLIDRLEGLAAARGKAAGPSVFRLEGAKGELGLLRREYHKVAGEIEKTLVVLGGRVAEPVPTPLPAPALAAAA